jgi:hypothetical protein
MSLPAPPLSTRIANKKRIGTRAMANVVERCASSPRGQPETHAVGTTAMTKSASSAFETVA